MFDRALAWPIATSGWRDKTFALSYLMSSDFYPSGAVLSVWDNRKTIAQLINAVNKIDDNVDSANSYDVASANFDRDENGTSQFLYDRRYVPDEYLKTLRDLDEAGVVPYETSIFYSNIFCNILHERAVSQIRMSNDRDPLLRHTIMNGNLTLAAVYGCYVFGMVSPAADKVTPMTSADGVQKLYPEIYSINHAAQTLDDLRDIMIDLEEEVKSGNASPNSILCNAVNNDSDYDILYRFAYEARGRQEFAPDSIPEVLKEGIEKTGRIFSADMENVRSAGSRAVLESFWRNTVTETLKTSLHPLQDDTE